MAGESSAHAVTPISTRTHDLMRQPVGVALFALAIVATGFYEPRFGGDFTGADVLILGVIVASVLGLRSGDWRADDVVRRLSVPVTLIVASGLFAAIHTGIRGWIVAELVRDVGVFLALVAAIDVLRRGGKWAVHWGFVAIGVTIPVVVAQLLLNRGSALRAAGTFPNPNIPAHLLACALILWSQAPFLSSRRRLVGVIGVIGVIGVLATASFGSILQLAVGFGYLLVSKRRRDPSRARINLAAVASVGVIVLLAVVGFRSVSPSGSTGLNQQRFGRSSSTRLEIWRQGLRSVPNVPFGIGPGSAQGLDITDLGAVCRANHCDKQLHNEPLAFLVERGVLGLTGLLLLWAALWKLGRPGGMARALVLAYIVASLFRETLHYRHFWLLLALAVVADELRSKREPSLTTPRDL